jgi:6-phosphogluconolactonase
MSKVILGISLFAAIFLSIFSCAQANPHGNIVYVGTYTDHGSKGIYAYRFNPVTGKFSSLGLAAETPSPSFLAISPDHKFLYAANEVSSFNGQPTGGVSAYAIHAAGKLTLLNQVSSKSPGPAFVTLDRSGKNILVANYTLGNVAVFPVKPDGQLGEATAFVQHHGSGVNKDRQQGPHAHMVQISPDNRFALVADLGIDQILIYPFDARKGTLGEGHAVKITAGSGPRHLIFDASGKFLYLINELSSTINVFSYSANDGSLAELQTISSFPKGFAGKSTAAEISFHPSGKFLYASNRGDDSIAVFAINKMKGTLTFLQNVSTQGKTPRHFTFDPSGKWLLVANQDSDNIVIFRVDPQTGRLNPSGQSVTLSSPVCIKFP